MKKLTWLTVTIISLTLLHACAMEAPMNTGQSLTLQLGFSGLEPLGEDYVYEGWLIVDGSPVSTGRFQVDADGNPDSDTIEITQETADAAGAFVLTIEPAVGDDPAPSHVHLLGGALDSGAADLTVGHGAALGTGFEDVSGSFILETPTTMDVAEDFNQGIWWLTPGEPHAPSLSLPELPEGWVYEGWVVGADGPISTGRFTEVAAADLDLAGPTAGPDGAGPPFPGQDFIDPSLVLSSGYAAVITVEPQPDNSPAPFTIKVLRNISMSDVRAPESQLMDNIASMTLPSGTAVISAASE